MEITIKKGKIEREKTEVIAVGCFEGELKSMPEETAAVDRALKGQIRDVVRSGEFKGKANQVLMLHVRGELPAKRVLLVGFGKSRDLSLETIRQAMGTAARAVRDSGLKAFSAPLYGRGRKKIPTGDSAQAVTEGCILGLYRFDDYRSGKNKNGIIKNLTLVDRGPGKTGDAEAGIRLGQVLAEATNYVRDLCNHPANVVTPTRLAEEARKIAREPGLSLRIIEREEAESLRMGAFLGVARGSQEPPKFIVLEYNNGKKKGPPVALVGKGVTFDSGGISLKPALNMETMKTDMSGGAAVLGAMRAVARLKLPGRIVGIVPATENMPSGRAIKPGDILKTMAGKTVEVVNTDAEGRLILADALAFAKGYKPSAIIDLATLTGACVVALGNHATGAMGNNAKLIEEIKKAGEACGERVWELPLWPEYHEQIKSDVADIRNVGVNGAGAITGAAFLENFVGDFPWVHLDIAGSSRSDQNRPYAPKGSTGVGVRLLIQWLKDRRRGRA
ncbi:MAG TPA: leucyl aminopeptidase [Nitrospiria bacterium]